LKGFARIRCRGWGKTGADSAGKHKIKRRTDTEPTRHATSQGGGKAYRRDATIQGGVVDLEMDRGKKHEKLSRERIRPSGKKDTFLRRKRKKRMVATKNIDGRVGKRSACNQEEKCRCSIKKPCRVPLLSRRSSSKETRSKARDLSTLENRAGSLGTPRKMSAIEKLESVV